MHLYNTVSQGCSKITAEQYSTSFSSAIRLLHKDLRPAIFNIYGFVRFADEIVDAFHDFDKETLLADYKLATYQAIEQGISANPILQSFQLTVNQYQIDPALIEAFFHSMEMDLGKVKYDTNLYNEYIYGSAEVVGLMCLHVFCEGNNLLHESLTNGARSLGAAFQKVNFLRDINADYKDLNRTYFPSADFENFTTAMKLEIEQDIAADFAASYEAITRLPNKARFGVYVAYKYYLCLFKRIKKEQPAELLQSRVRIDNFNKAFIVMRAGIRNQLNIL